MDPRLTPARADLAAKHLEGQVTAARFVEGVLQEVMDPQAPVRREPRPDGALDTEALLGERVTVYETTDEGWSWGQLQSDGYVGWLPAFALARPRAEPTHRVSALRTLAFPGPSIKIPPVQSPPLGARIAIARQQDRFAVTPNGLYLPAQHLAPLDAYESDFVRVAERFVGAPYLWGGKTSLGLDCSGLVQVALTACGLTCPRDSDMQERALGAALDKDAKLQRGDLIFWKGHVAIARDEVSMIHANAFHMAVTIEPIGEAVARIAAGGSSVTSVKRLAL
jgi:cell wall-associated NlpC family hydrolase